MFPWILLLCAQAQTVRTVPPLTVGGAVVASSPGDIIEVDAASAFDRVVDQDVPVTLDVTIRGVNGRPTLPRLIVSEGAHLTLEEVALEGIGEPFGLDVGDVGLVVDGSSATLDGVSLWPSNQGWGILGNDATLVLHDVTAVSHVGPVVTALGGSLEITDSEFADNGGGVVVGVNADIAVYSTSFFGNWTWGTGADIAVRNDVLKPLTIDDCTFDGSFSSQAGSVLAATSDLVLSNSTFTGTSAWANGGALAAWGENAGATVLIESTTFDTAWAANGGAVVLVDLDSALVDNSTFVGNEAVNGGALQISTTAAVVQGSVFEDNAVGLYGGAIVVGATPDDYGYTYTTFPYPPYYPGYTVYTGYTPPGTGPTIPPEDQVGPSSLDLIDTELRGTPGTTEALIGGCVHGMADSTLTVTGGRFEDCGADLDGGAIAFDGTKLDVVGTDFHGNSAGWWGGAITQGTGRMVVDQALFDSNVAANGSAIRTVNTHNEIRQSTFTTNVANNAGAVELVDTREITLTNNRWCHNVVQSAGAIVNITGGIGGPYRVANNVWLANTSDLGSAFRYAPANWLGNVGPALDLHNNDFVANDLGKAASVKGQIDVRNNIFVVHPIGLVLENAAWNNQLTGGYNLWADQTNHAEGTEGAFPTDTALVGVDPLFQGADPQDCFSNLWLDVDSPARDAGDPQILDVDGSRSDIGAYGGPESGLKDGDGDGWLEDLDCDDTDAKVHPGGVDIPYDGIDSDCDGADLCDGDGDGFDAVACGGTDCDDTRPRVHPGVPDLLDDGLDNDCDGFERTSFLAGGGCACDQSGPTGSAVWVLGLLALARRRR